MYYKDELGFEINLPRLPNETVLESIRSSCDTLVTMLSIRNDRLRGNSCENPLVKEIRNERPVP